ncbi:hypothetical protein BN873_950041 [Candidatus Competibacter denitrificans Run_A_D11]|uniref:Uncharacterized protein n=1 Tax=Candidatus Competibacter denitrificans Run_A_D11 TaxID=1400863 RepID=W6MEC2_9GAMM|nr:hypothetical protein BN873_950041 [Candidatus Competibacter denitrificans Run_A_D11]
MKQETLGPLRYLLERGQMQTKKIAWTLSQRDGAQAQKPSILARATPAGAGLWKIKGRRVRSPIVRRAIA